LSEFVMPSFLENHPGRKLASIATAMVQTSAYESDSRSWITSCLFVSAGFLEIVPSRDPHEVFRVLHRTPPQLALDNSALPPALRLLRIKAKDLLKYLIQASLILVDAHLQRPTFRTEIPSTQRPIYRELSRMYPQVFPVIDPTIAFESTQVGLLKDRISIINYILYSCVNDGLSIEEATENARTDWRRVSLRAAALDSARKLRIAALSFQPGEQTVQYSGVSAASGASVTSDISDDSGAAETQQQASSLFEELESELNLEQSGATPQTEQALPRMSSLSHCAYRYRIVASTVSESRLDECAECFQEVQQGEAWRFCLMCSSRGLKFHLSCSPAVPFVRRRYAWPSVVVRNAQRLLPSSDGEAMAVMYLDKALCSACGRHFVAPELVWYCPFCDSVAMHDSCSTFQGE
jgi:hypothetical protein